MITKYELDKAERKHDDEVKKLLYAKEYHGGRIVIESQVTHYAGGDGGSILGFTDEESGWLVRKHPSVIGMAAYSERKDPKDMDFETTIHELRHDRYHSEGQNRAEVAEYMWRRGKQPSEMHTKFSAAA